MRKDRDTPGRDLTRHDLEQLIDAGVIREDRRADLMKNHRRCVDWRSWTGFWAAALGSVFFLAGVVFFFAWNWNQLSPLVRFATLEGAVVLATLGAVFMTSRKTGFQWSLTAACVLTGVLVAVYGQVYQTGADAYEVFALWAALISVWVLISRFAPLWFLWLALLQTVAATYAGQILVPEEILRWPTVHLILGLASACVLCLRECLVKRERFAWLQSDWIRVALVASTLVWLSLIPWELIIDVWGRPEVDLLSSIMGVIAWLGAVVGGAVFYTRCRPSLTSLGLCLLAGSIILVSTLGRIILEASDTHAVGWLVLGICSIVIFSGMAMLLAKAARFITAKETAHH